MKPFIRLVIAVLCVHTVSAVKLAGLYPLTGADAPRGVQVAKAVQLAVSAVNADATITLGGSTLTLSAIDSGSGLGSAATASFAAVTTTPSSDQPAAIVGGLTNAGTEGAAVVGRVVTPSVPVVSYGAQTDLLSDGDDFPTFSRVVGADTDQGAAAAAFLTAVGWRHVAVIAADSQASSFVSPFTAAVLAAGAAVEAVVEHASVEAVTDPSSAAYASAVASVSSALDAIRASPARVIVMHNLQSDARFVLQLAVAAGMVGSDPATGDFFQWVGTDQWVADDLFVVAPLCNAACVSALQTATVGMLGLQLSTAGRDAAAFSAWVSDVWAPAAGPGKLSASEQSTSQRSDWLGDNMDPLVPFAWDAVWLAARALDQLCSTSACSNMPADRAGLTAVVQALSFNGLSGPVALNGTPDRRVPFSLLSFQPGTAASSGRPTFTTCGTWQPSAAAVSVTPSAIYWATPDGNQPSGVAVITCAAGQQLEQAVSGVSFCVECAAGTYNLDGVTCLACPTGAVCPGGAELRTKIGYWRGSLALNEGLKFYPCRPDPSVCCPSGNCTAYPDIPASAAVNPVCSKNREGRLCGRCVSGTSEWDGVCVECDGVNVGAFAGLAVSAATVAALFLASRLPDSAVKRSIVDYMQLGALLITPLPGRSGVTGFLETDLLNLDVSGLFSNGDSEKPDGTCLLPVNQVWSVCFGYFLPVLILAWIGVFAAAVRALVCCFPTGLPCLRKKAAGAAGAAGSGAAAGSGGAVVLQTNPVARKQRAERLARTRQKAANGAGGGPTALQRLMQQEEASLEMQRRRAQVVHMPAQRLYIALWRLLFVSFNVVTLTGFQLVLCRDVDGVRVLELAPGVTCNRKPHQPAFVVAVLLLVLFVACVPVWSTFLYVKYVRQRGVDRRLLAADKVLLDLRNQLRGSHMPGGTTAAAATASAPNVGADPASAAPVVSTAVLLGGGAGGGGGAGAGAGAGAGGGGGAGADNDKIAASSTNLSVEEQDDLDLEAAGPLFVEMFKLYRYRVRGWFEAVYFTRRALVAFLLVSLVEDFLWRALAGFLVTIASLFWVIAWRPFARRSDNVLSMALFGSASVIAGLELYEVNNYLRELAANESDSNDGRRLFVDVLYIVLFTWPLLFLARFKVATVVGKVVAKLAARRATQAAVWRQRHNSVVLSHSDEPDSAAASDGIELGGWAGAGAGAGTSREAKDVQTLSHELSYLSRVATNDAHRAVRAAKDPNA